MGEFVLCLTRMQKKKKKKMDVAQLVERRTGTPLTQIRFPGAERDFSPRVNFQCRLSYGVHTPLSGLKYGKNRIAGDGGDVAQLVERRTGTPLWQV